MCNPCNMQKALNSDGKISHKINSINPMENLGGDDSSSWSFSSISFCWAVNWSYSCMYANMHTSVIRTVLQFSASQKMIVINTNKY